MAIKLIKYGFDSMENRRPKYVEEEYYFTTDKNGTAREKVEKYLKDMKNTRLYLGYDNNVYPKFKVKEITIN